MQNEKKWLKLLGERPCVITGSNYTQLHHVAGRTYKHHKVLIGPWFVLPLAVELHDVSSNHPLNVTHHRKLFSAEYGSQAILWFDMVLDIECDLYCRRIKNNFFGMDVVEAILDTRF